MGESSETTVVGIDVGGNRKGYHAVALRDGQLEPKHFLEASDVRDWCRHQAARCVALDAPCAWAASGGARLAERSLAVGGCKIQCFKTPTRAAAKGRAFFEWVFSGESLYQCLQTDYQLFDGPALGSKIMFETFPHAVVCSLVGRVIPARSKASTRRRILRDLGYDESRLGNIDFVDAALCAVAAERFLHGKTRAFGDSAEGYILVPDYEAAPESGAAVVFA